MSPPNSRVCVRCASGELSRTARSLKLGWLSCLTTWFLVLLGARWCFSHAHWLLGNAAAVAGAVFTFATGVSPVAVAAAATRLAAVIALLVYGFSLMLPREQRGAFRHGVWRLFAWGARASARLTFRAARQLVFAVHGRPHRTASKEVRTWETTDR
jgi:hypothetical protein